jgi:hypothetical protein
MIEEFADGRQPGECLFATSSGKPLKPWYVRKYIILQNSIPAFIPSVVSEAPECEEQGTPRSLLDQWIGHSNGNVTDRYIKSAEDREFRRKQVERIGTGLNLSDPTLSFHRSPVRGPTTTKPQRNPAPAKIPQLRSS